MTAKAPRTNRTPRRVRPRAKPVVPARRGTMRTTGKTRTRTSRAAPNAVRLPFTPASACGPSAGSGRSISAKVSREPTAAVHGTTPTRVRLARLPITETDNRHARPSSRVGHHVTRDMQTPTARPRPTVIRRPTANPRSKPTRRNPRRRRRRARRSPPSPLSAPRPPRRSHRPLPRARPHRSRSKPRPRPSRRRSPPTTRTRPPRSPAPMCLAARSGLRCTDASICVRAWRRSARPSATKTAGEPRVPTVGSSVLASATASPKNARVARHSSTGRAPTWNASCGCRRNAPSSSRPTAGAGGSGRRPVEVAGPAWVYATRPKPETPIAPASSFGVSSWDGSI